MSRLWIVVAFLAWWMGPSCPGWAAAGKAGPESAGRFALDYADALAHSRIQAWASSDLGCLTRHRQVLIGSLVSKEKAERCWTDTLQAHTDLVAQESEQGVFQAVGRGVGFGLLHDRHRASENWKEYPPAVFLSPPVVQRDHGSAPDITLARVGPVKPIAVVGLTGTEPVPLKGQAVDLKIIYADPMTAPLALRPEEVWWVSGVQRRFGPVREVQTRFIVVSGLRKFGYAADRAVMNEALPGSPLIATTHYGLRPDAGRRYEHLEQEGLLKGELLMGSARWWERSNAEGPYREALIRAAHMPSSERSGLLTRLLLLDPTDAEAHALRGDDAYADFLKQGVLKGGLAARDEDALRRQAELYWTVQAQTWRQELTAVAEGYEPAADTLYRAIASYETVAQQPHSSREQRRRLGALNRWNNDPVAALALHEPLLADTPADSPEYGRLLTEMAWDRIQWVSWERRYDHPWLDQAAREARQAVALLDQAHDRLVANYALAAVEALRVPRDTDAFQRHLQEVKRDVDQIPGTKGLKGHLLANDLVKALTLEAQTIVLPSPPRSMEVLDVAVHANTPKQDIVWQWNFENERPGDFPAGFSVLGQQGSTIPVWQVLADQEGPKENRLLGQSEPCPTPECVRLLVADPAHTTYPDVAVLIRTADEARDGEAGIALAVRDTDNYYAITLQPSTGVVTTRRVSNGAVTVLGRVSVKLAPKRWHSMRVQRINFLHLDKGRLSVFLDGAQVAAVDDAVLPQEGRIGLITMGPIAAEFDSLHVLDLVSNRPLSKPAAY